LRTFPLRKLASRIYANAKISFTLKYATKSKIAVTLSIRTRGYFAGSLRQAQALRLVAKYTVQICRATAYIPSDQ
jgi:hypothetical protein